MSAHNAKMSRRGPPPHSGVATARRPVFNFNSGSAPSPDRCLNQGKSSLIKVNQGKSRWKKWVGPASRGQPANRASDGHRWNGERCCGWLSPKPRSDPTIPPARLAIGSSFPSDTNCGFMRFLSCLQIFVSHPVTSPRRKSFLHRRPAPLCYHDEFCFFEIPCPG